MAVSEQTLGNINYIISVYVGYVIIATGLIGNLINIFVFTQLKLFRKNPAALYLTVASIVECFQIIFSSTTRVIATTFGYDPTRASIVWCKLRAYLVQLGATVLLGIICFSAVDQYLSTSHHNRMRQISTYKLAQQATIILILSSALYCISFPIFNEIRSTSGCTTYNPTYNYYYSFVHLCIIIGILPIIIASFFSLLSFRNVRRIVRRQIPIVRRRLDRQLTAMILIRVALFVITTLPLVTVRTYQINNPVNFGDTYAVAVDQLLRTSVTTFYNINYSGSFYVFWVSSTRFRRQVKYVFSKKIWNKCWPVRANRNNVGPADQIQNTEGNVSATDLD